MKLQDLLEVIYDSEKVKVLNSEGVELCRYDGKEGIEEEYNQCEIVGVFVFDGLCVIVKHE